jgi:hypothetical protein
LSNDEIGASLEFIKRYSTIADTKKKDLSFYLKSEGLAAFTVAGIASRILH